MHSNLELWFISSILKIIKRSIILFCSSPDLLKTPSPLWFPPPVHSYLHGVILGVVGLHLRVQVKFVVRVFGSLRVDADLSILHGDCHGATSCRCQFPQDEIHSYNDSNSLESPKYCYYQIKTKTDINLWNHNIIDLLSQFWVIIFKWSTV